MAGVRMTGLVSGLDTESIVGQLSEAYQTKVDNIKKEQTKAEWKKEAWASLNTKIMDFYKGALSTFKSVSSYRAKAATGDLKGVKVTASNTAVNGTHRVQVKETAAAQMWTGKQINNKTYTATSYTPAVDGTKKLSELRDDSGNYIGSRLQDVAFKVSANGKSYDVKVNVGGDATIDDVVQNINDQLKDSGLTVEFAGGNFRLSNNSSTATTETDADGKTINKMEGGYAITINGASEETAAIFGIKAGDEGTTIQPASAAQNDTDVVNVIGGSQRFNITVEKEDASIKGSSKLTDLGIAAGTEIKLNGKAITVSNTMTLDQLANQMAKMGIEANYDEGQGRFYLNAKNTGTANGFTVEADDDTLAKLGLDLADGDPAKIEAKDAEIEYNGVKYTQATNSFNINGLTIDATEKGDVQTFTVGTDAQGIYDKVKEFVKSYNTLIGEMNTLYSAERLKDYEPLTDKEKSAMDEKDVEKWESTIKASLLRRDDTISSLLTSMRTTLSKAVQVTDADGNTKSFSLASFGINTSTYTEKGKLHIDGDKDDADFADLDDKLMKAIMNNPNAVEKTLSTLGSEIYSNLQKAMGSVEGMSSALTFYNDKYMDDEIADYKEKVSNMQDKMTAEEDKYYKQFAAMESAMAKLQSQQTYISQLFGA
ncbi:MAG: flagellar filament capping protein FliD [Clostridiales bacterium]|nr:flagellar filament capping protein FliD [Clostridiales bacterium]